MVSSIYGGVTDSPRLQLLIFICTTSFTASLLAPSTISQHCLCDTCSFNHSQDVLVVTKLKREIAAQSHRTQNVVAGHCMACGVYYGYHTNNPNCSIIYPKKKKNQRISWKTEGVSLTWNKFLTLFHESGSNLAAVTLTYRTGQPGPYSLRPHSFHVSAQNRL